MIVTLGSVCTKSSSNIRQKDIADSTGKYPIYGASGLIGYVDFYQHDKPYIAVVKDGAGVGRVYLLPAYSSIIGTMQGLVPNDDVLPEYLYYVAKQLHLERHYTGATIPHIYFKDYKEDRFRLVNLSEQRNIVELFRKIESIIDSKQKVLNDLNTLVKARFVEMFGDTKLNMKKFPQEKLSKIAKVGSSRRVFARDFQDSGIPFFRGTEVGALAEGKKIIPKLFISKKLYKELVLATGKPKIGDLLMPSICPDGRIWQVNTDEEFYFKDARVLWISPNSSDKVNSTYLRYALKQVLINNYRSVASGSTFAEMKIVSLKRLMIILPPIELQNQFASFVQQVDKSKVAIQKSLDEAQTLFDSLMQEYFS